MKIKKTLALTLGLSLAVGGLTMGTTTVAQANQIPAEMHTMQMEHQRTIYDLVNHKEMLTLLQIDDQTFKQEKDSGKSLAQIGLAHKASRQSILDLVTRHMNHQIDKGLRDHRITAAQATEMKTNAVETAKMMIDKQPMRPMGPLGPMTPMELIGPMESIGQVSSDRMSNRAVSPEILILLQMDEQTFRQDLDNGKTLAQIASAHNVSRQTMVDLVAKEMRQYIDQSLADQYITPAQATEMKTNAADKAEKIVDRSMMDYSTQPQR